MTPEWEEFERKLAELKSAVTSVRGKFHNLSLSEIETLLKLVAASNGEMIAVRVALDNARAARKNSN